MMHGQQNVKSLTWRYNERSEM